MISLKIFLEIGGGDLIERTQNLFLNLPRR